MYPIGSNGSAQAIMDTRALTGALRYEQLARFAPGRVGMPS